MPACDTRWPDINRRVCRGQFLWAEARAKCFLRRTRRRKKRITIYLRPAGRELGETVCAARQLPGGTFFATRAIIFLRNKNFVPIAFLLAKF